MKKAFIQLKLSLLLFFVFIVTGIHAQTAGRLPLIPYPQEVQTLRKGNMDIRDVSVKIDSNIKLPAEGYILTASRGKVEITAKDKRGSIWAQQTLEQLKDENGQVPQVKITDWPAFSIRGFMHDLGRTYQTVETIKHHIDILSHYKINVLHLHLTDNPSWRIESRVHPELNDPKYQQKGRDEGLFYTYDELRDIIAYAGERGLMVIPEIDMPGHSQYFKDLYGFGMSDPRGMKILEDCLNEFFAEIPATDCPYMHIGSDEVHIPNPAEFMQWAENLVKANNRIPVIWNPGLQGSPETIRHIWHEGELKKAAASNDPAVNGKYIDSSAGYLNYYDPVLFVSRMFVHNPAGKAYGDDMALGGEVCLWTDVRTVDKANVIRYNGVWPGTLAFAERYWHGGLTPKGVKSSELMPGAHTPAGKALVEFEQRLDFHKKHRMKNEPFHWAPNAALRWYISDVVPVENVDVEGEFHWFEAYGGVIDLDNFCEYILDKVKTGAVWAETTLIAPNDTVIDAWIGFEAAARSNRISVGIGKEGEWEANGKVWLNGEPVAPPKWNEPGAYAFHFPTWFKPSGEIPYTDEQFYWTRTPTRLSLKKGENHVKIFAPKVFEGQRWTFTFIPLW